MNKELIVMKTLTLVVALTAAATLCRAQEGSPDRVTVPLADPSRPAKLIVSCVNGRITVHAGANREIAVEAKGGAGKHRNVERDGLRRIETGGSGLSIDQAENVVTVTTHSFMTNADLSFQVPANTALKLKSVMGDVSIDGVSGDIEVESTNGRMTLTNVSGAALVHGVNGSITATFTRVPADKPMSFSSLNGDIDVSLPADTRARLKMKTNNGDAYSDFDIQLQPQNTVVADSGDGNRKHRHISIDRATTRTISGAAPETQLVTFNAIRQ